MTAQLDVPDVLETLTAMQPDSVDLAKAWHPLRQRAVLRRVLAEPAPRSNHRAKARWIGAAVAAAAVTTAGFLLAPSLLPAPVTAIPSPNPWGPITEPTWVEIAEGPLSPRFEARGAWVDGRYLLVSGHTDPCGPIESDCTPADPDLLTDGALYDPATDSWTPIAPAPIVEDRLSEPVALGTSAYFLTGRIVGPTEPQTARDEFFPGEQQVLLRYDLKTGAWSSHPLPKPSGGQLVATDGAVLVLSGSDLGGELDDLVFDPGTAAWSTLPNDPLGPSQLREAVWVDHRLVLSALPLDASDGPDYDPLRLAVLDAGLATWSDLETTAPVYGYDPLAVGDRVVWESNSDRYEIVDDKRTHEYYSSLDPATGEVTDIKAPFEVGFLTGAWLATADQLTVEGDLYDPVADAWTTIPAFKVPAGVVLTTWLSGPDSLLLWGGNVPLTSSGRLLLLPPP